MVIVRYGMQASESDQHFIEGSYCNKALEQGNLISLEDEHRTSTPIPGNMLGSAPTIDDWVYEGSPTDEDSPTDEANLSSRAGVAGASVVAAPLRTIADKCEEVKKLEPKELSSGLAETILDNLYNLLGNVEIADKRNSGKTRYGDEYEDHPQNTLAVLRLKACEGENLVLLERQKELEEEKRGLSAEMAKLTKENAQLKSAQQSSDAIIDKFRSTEIQLKEELGGANKKLMQEQQEASRSNNQANDLAKKLKGAQAQLARLQKQADYERESREGMSRTHQFNLSKRDDKVAKLTGEKIQLEDKLKAMIDKNAHLESKLESAQEALDEKDRTRPTEESITLKDELEMENFGDNSLKTELQESEIRSKELESQIENKLDSVNGKGLQLAERLNSMQQSPNPDNETKKLLAVSAQSRKQITYASVSFVLSGAFAVGASLTMSHLAICISLAVAALTFLAVGCYCSYKANTALSDVGIDQINDFNLPSVGV